MAAIKIFWVFLHFLVLASTGYQKHHKHRKDVSKRITNGITVDIKDAKYYAFLQCGGKECGATLVTKNRVLTAAHCVISCKPDDVVFYMGMNSRSEIYDGAAEAYGITEIHIYPKYETEARLNNDIAVLYVDGEVTESDNIRWIPYATSRPVLNGSTSITCLGYGTTESGDPAQKLQKSPFIIKEYRENRIVTSVSSSTVLFGDSGGPCIYNNELVGVIAGIGKRDGIVVENYIVATGAPDVLPFIRSHGL